MRSIPFVVAAVAFTQMGATDCGQVIKDSGFDLWCGDALCSWKTERGTIERVPTWNAGDSGVQLDGAATAIEQFTSFNSSDGTCLTFDLVANIDDDAEVYLNVDIEGDGTLEMHERLPTSKWQPLTYSIAFATPFDGVRFEIAKTGSGNAVLANIGASTADPSTCAGLSKLDPGPRKNGASCAGNADCASNLCGGLGVCEGCVPDSSTCGTGMTCGLGVAIAPILETPVTCVADAAKQIGERCLGNDECASAICQTGVCSSCSSAAMCGAGACRPAWTDASFLVGPSTCSLGKPGDACGADGDCTSGHCSGSARMECDDGRPCATRDDCPIASDLTQGACTTVGIQGGSCE